jgi:hypothetical protein
MLGNTLSLRQIIPIGTSITIGPTRQQRTRATPDAFLTLKLGANWDAGR